jgi:hypothetical protein
MPFRECPKCRHLWPDGESFLSDSSLRFLGYQVNYEELNDGLFLFVHHIPSCGTSLAVKPGDFINMHKWPVFGDCLANTEQCAGHCPNVDDLNPCPQPCNCAYVRDIMQGVKQKLAQAHVRHKRACSRAGDTDLDIPGNSADIPELTESRVEHEPYTEYAGYR